MPHRCVVIGASAGGFEVLVDMVSQLPAELPVPVFVVMHVAAYQSSYLPEILSRAGPLPAIHPKDGVRVKPGTIYVAPPDRHLLIDDGHVAVNRGPKENGFRPSIDALFRSAAYSYGPAAIGVVLSGALHDGASGLWSIKRLGGTAIVQDPAEAEYPSMPRSALEYVQADYQVRSNEVAGLLVRLVNEPPVQEMAIADPSKASDEKRIAKEIQIAAGSDLPQQSILELGELSPFTCPECHGVLVKIVEGKLTRFRCHTGHGFTEDALLEAIVQTTGKALWQVTRGFQEAQMLLEHIGRHIQERGDAERADKFFATARAMQKKATIFQRYASEQESLSTENIEEPPEE